MVVFISSVIKGLETFRDAAARGISSLGYRVVRSEDFGALADSPQQTCLRGVREANAVLLLMGPRYGEKTNSGLSATHEEYREARERVPVLVFTLNGVKTESEQGRFLTEVQAWESGHYTERFSTPDQLQGSVVRALHNLALSQAAGPVDGTKMLDRAVNLIKHLERYSGPVLALATSSAPRQTILRPTEIEEHSLSEAVMQRALFGPEKLFDPGKGTEHRIAHDALLITQEGTSILIDAEGSVRIAQAASPERRNRQVWLPVLIEEEIAEQLVHALRFTSWILDRIDPQRRISHVVPAASLIQTEFRPLLTKEEAARSSNSVTMRMGTEEPLVHLAPEERRRAMLASQPEAIAQDLMALLRRRMKK